MRLLRYCLAIVISLMAITSIQSQDKSPNSAAVMTNSDVVQMVKSGLSPELVIAKIKASKTRFDTSPVVLSELKQNGVSENILVAMVESGPVTPSTTLSPPPPDSQMESARSAVRALRRLASTTEVGVSYVNYSPLVGEVKAEVEDALSRMRAGNLKASIQASLNEYAYAAYVWQATWRSDWVEGQLKDEAVKKYGVPKRGLLKVVWRVDFLNAIWREARNQFEIANTILSQSQPSPSVDASAPGQADLAGAWQIVIKGNNGQDVQFNLTIVKSGDGYRGTMRSSVGNSDNVRITKNGNSFAIYASEQQKKTTLSIQLEGTLEATVMRGNATVGNGKQTATLPFTGTRLGN